MYKQISVVIPSYNSGQTIGATLNGLKGQRDMGLLAEIIVVDSSDDGDTQTVLVDYMSDGVKMINAGRKVMPAIARNLGAKEAVGDILAFIDADAYPADDWLINIAEANKKGYCVGGGGIALPDFQRYGISASAQYYLQFNEFIPSGGTRRKKFVPSCNMFCRKELFEKIGGFPELRAAEDVLFGLSANKIAELWFIPSIKVYHIFNESWRRIVDNQMLLGKYTILYRAMSSDSFMYRSIAPLLLFPAFLCIKICRITFRIAKAGWGHLCRFIVVLPVFMFGLLFWSGGFIQGCLSNKTRYDSLE